MAQTSNAPTPKNSSAAQNSNNSFLPAFKKLGLNPLLNKISQCWNRVTSSLSKSWLAFLTIKFGMLSASRRRVQSRRCPWKSKSWPSNCSVLVFALSRSLAVSRNNPAKREQSRWWWCGIRKWRDSEVWYCAYHPWAARRHSRWLSGNSIERSLTLLRKLDLGFKQQVRRKRLS